MSPHIRNNRNIKGIASLFLTTLLFFFATPAFAICCKCHTKAAPSDNLCLTDTAATDCASLLAKNAANKALDTITCDPAPAAPDVFDETTKCKPLSTGGSAMCTAGPVSAVSYTAPPATAAAPTITTVASVPLELGVPIPGLTFSKNFVATNGNIEIPFLAQYLSAIYNYLLGIVVITAAVMIVYGGFKYVLSSTVAGVQSGKDVISDAIVGLVVLLSSVTILSAINPATTQFQSLKIKIVDPVPFALEHNMDHPGPHDFEGTSGGGAGTPLASVEGRPNYKPRDWSMKTSDYPGLDSDGSCNPTAGVKAYDFKQGGDEWGSQPGGSLRLCSKTTIADDPTNTKKETEYVFFNSTGHDGNGSPAPPCCVSYQDSACGASSAAIVMNAYGEPITPGIMGEQIIRAGARHCNYAGFHPSFAMSKYPDFEIKNNYNKANLVADLKAGYPKEFLCSGCHMKTIEIVGRTPHPELFSKDDSWGGHYMVLTGVYTDGNFAVANPGNSPIKAPDGKLVPYDNWISQDEVMSSRVGIVNIVRKDGAKIKACQ